MPSTDRSGELTPTLGGGDQILFQNLITLLGEEMLPDVWSEPLPPGTALKHSHKSYHWIPEKILLKLSHSLLTSTSSCQSVLPFQFV